MRDAAARVATLIPRERLDPEVLAWVARAPRRGGWGVGLSGGADSVTLLLLLWAHWPERRRLLRVLHFNHRMRGAEATADAKFCRGLAAALGVRFCSGSWRAGSPQASEAEARKARLAFLKQHARVVWFGHQQDDIAESMLMRLARGSGAGGLGAPRPVQRFADGRVHLRPLLALKKAEMIRVLRTAGVKWREDSSNAEGGFLRNRIRREVVPRWIRAARRDALAGAARSRLLLAEDDAACEAWLDEIRPLDAAGRLHLSRLKGRPRALWRRALHHWLAFHTETGDLSRQAFDLLLTAIGEGNPTRQSVGKDTFAVVAGETLRLETSRKSPRRIRRRPN